MQLGPPIEPTPLRVILLLVEKKLLIAANISVYELIIMTNLRRDRPNSGCESASIRYLFQTEFGFHTAGFLW